MHYRFAITLFLLALGLTPLAAYAQESQKTPLITSSSTTSISEEMIGAKHGHMVLGKNASIDTYGYKPESPVPVGGGFSKGSKNTYRFLNALLGPDGQEVHYTRVGTCCEFKTSNSPFGDSALLEVYEITFEGAKKPSRLYFNWYDPGEVLIPVGLTAVK